MGDIGAETDRPSAHLLRPSVGFGRQEYVNSLVIHWPWPWCIGNVADPPAAHAVRAVARANPPDWASRTVD